MTMIEAIVSALWVMGTITSWYAIVMLLLSVILWGVRFRWWDNEIGRNFWSFTALLLLLIANNFVGSVGAQDFTGRAWWEPAPNTFFFFYVSRYLIFFGIAVVVTHRLFILHKHWRAGVAMNMQLDVRTRAPKS